MIKDPEMGNFIGLLSGKLNAITRVLIKGKQKHQVKKGDVKGRGDKER